MIAQAGGGTAVIIPFFQRKPGLLAAAIRSALTQEAAGPITVVVCDDASPIPAPAELAGLVPEQRERVILVTQANSGPGPARNAALDRVPPGTEWIAFLDSDDRWEPTHLARAIAALQEGYDLCFADALRDPDLSTHFQSASFKPSEHEAIGSSPGLFRFEGDFLTLNITLSPVSISTVVVRASVLGDMRFPYMAFEDLMYWFEAARRRPRIAFDGTLQVYYGRGDITVAEGWASQSHLKNRLSYHRIFRRVAREFILTSSQRALLEARMSRNRRAFGQATLDLLRQGQAPAWHILNGFMWLDPRLARSLLRVAGGGLVRRVLRRRRMQAA